MNFPSFRFVFFPLLTSMFAKGNNKKKNEIEWETCTCDAMSPIILFEKKKTYKKTENMFIVCLLYISIL